MRACRAFVSELQEGLSNKSLFIIDAVHGSNRANLSHRKALLHQRTCLSNGGCLFNVLSPNNFIARDAFTSLNKGAIRENLVFGHISPCDQKRFSFYIVAAFY